MGSTHYMDLLMQDSPWNLILFMAIPVVLAESIAISELFLLWSQKKIPALDNFRKTCGVLAGIAFLIIIIYFIFNVVTPLTQADEWRTWIDVVAIVSYLLAGIPMILIALLNLRWIAPSAPERARSLYHIVCLSVFLVFSHIAMIFGMVDPTIAGYEAQGHGHAMSEMSHSHEHHSHGAMDMGSVPSASQAAGGTASVPEHDHHSHSMEPSDSMHKHH